jgi:hypothetical protein
MLKHDRVSIVSGRPNAHAIFKEELIDTEGPVSVDGILFGEN